MSLALGTSVTRSGPPKRLTCGNIADVAGEAPAGLGGKHQAAGTLARVSCQPAGPCLQAALRPRAARTSRAPIVRILV